MIQGQGAALEKSKEVRGGGELKIMLTPRAAAAEMRQTFVAKKGV